MLAEKQYPVEGRFHKFETASPAMCTDLDIERDDLTYNDYTNLVSKWPRA